MLVNLKKYEKNITYWLFRFYLIFFKEAIQFEIPLFVNYRCVYYFCNKHKQLSFSFFVIFAIYPW